MDGIQEPSGVYYSLWSSNCSAFILSFFVTFRVRKRVPRDSSYLSKKKDACVCMITGFRLFSVSLASAPGIGRRALFWTGVPISGFGMGWMAYGVGAVLVCKENEHIGRVGWYNNHILSLATPLELLVGWTIPDFLWRVECFAEQKTTSLAKFQTLRIRQTLHSSKKSSLDHKIMVQEYRANLIELGKTPLAE